MSLLPGSREERDRGRPQPRLFRLQRSGLGSGPNPTLAVRDQLSPEIHSWVLDELGEEEAYSPRCGPVPGVSVSRALLDSSRRRRSPARGTCRGRRRPCGSSCSRRSRRRSPAAGSGRAGRPLVPRDPIPPLNRLGATPGATTSGRAGCLGIGAHQVRIADAAREPPAPSASRSRSPSGRGADDARPPRRPGSRARQRRGPRPLGPAPSGTPTSTASASPTRTGPSSVPPVPALPACSASSSSSSASASAGTDPLMKMHPYLRSLSVQRMAGVLSALIAGPTSDGPQRRDWYLNE